MYRSSIMEKEDEIDLDCNLFDVDEKIKIATQTLDRNIKFVNNCDNKASFMLATVGVILTIVFSEDKIFNLIKVILKELSIEKEVGINNVGMVIYLLVLLVLLVLTIIGIICLVSVFYAQIKGSTRKSLIFFEGICCYEDYFQSFKTVKKYELLDDLIDQINVNSKIATKKYKRYNAGFLCSTIGLFLFIVMLTILMFSIG